MRHCTPVLLMTVAFAACAEPASTAAELIRADSTFAVETAEGGADAWTSWFEADGSMVRGDGDVVGHADIRAAMEPVLSDPSIRFSWTPERAIIGDAALGATVGSYQIVATDSPARVLEQGRYLTVWRRQEDGAWKVVVDIGAPDQ